MSLLANLAEVLQNGAGSREDPHLASSTRPLSCTERRRPELKPAIPAAASLHYDLAFALSRRYRQPGNASDLDEAADFYQIALDALRPGDPDRPWMLVGRARTLLRRFEKAGDRDDLEEAVKLGQEAIARPIRLVLIQREITFLLADALWLRSERFGGLGDLNESIRLMRETLASDTSRRRRSVTYLVPSRAVLFGSGSSVPAI